MRRLVPSRFRSWPLAAIVGLLLPSLAPAQSDGVAALASLGDALEVGRQVEAMGDEPVLAAMEADRLALRLGAIRGARWLAAPEEALPTLAALAAGDDPDLAPAAARAGAEIAAELRVDDLTAREADVAALDPAPWQALADDASARADLRGIGARVAQVISRLEGSGASPSE